MGRLLSQGGERIVLGVSIDSALVLTSGANQGGWTGWRRARWSQAVSWARRRPSTSYRFSSRSRRYHGGSKPKEARVARQMDEERREMRLVGW